MPTIFITGIDTDAGKTVATGLLARYLVRQGASVITQKLVQTGCHGMPEDVLVHRRLMGKELTNADRQGLTCPYVFELPVSPHLASREEQVVIDPKKIALATAQLEQQYEYVLLEGVGGVYVPLHDSLTVLDYLEKQGYPVILVSSAKLGSINHTLLTLEALSRRGLNVLGIVYNEYPAAPLRIAEDSQQVFRAFLPRFGYKATLISMPTIHPDTDEISEVDFSALLKM